MRRPPSHGGQIRGGAIFGRGATNAGGAIFAAGVQQVANRRGGRDGRGFLRVREVGACGKAAAPSGGFGLLTRPFRRGVHPCALRLPPSVASKPPHFPPLAFVPYRNARVIIQVGAGASPSSKLQPVNNSAAIFRLPYWYGNGTRIAPPRIARSCRATTGVRLSGGDDASEIKRILQMQTPVKSLL